MLAILGAVWGIAGIGLLLGFAIQRLLPHALAALEAGLAWHHWLALAACVLIMAYAEGYRGFQKAFSPRVAARCRYLHQHPTPLRILAAPLFCMGFFHATRRRRLTSLALTLAIVLMVVGVQHLAQPWRGILDAGVLVGLLWGLAATLAYTALAFLSADFPHSPEVGPEAG